MLYAHLCIIYFPRKRKMWCQLIIPIVLTGILDCLWAHLFSSKMFQTETRYFVTKWKWSMPSRFVSLFIFDAENTQIFHLGFDKHISNIFSKIIITHTSGYTRRLMPLSCLLSFINSSVSNKNCILTAGFQELKFFLSSVPDFREVLGA